MNSATIAQKLWSYSKLLREDGMSYGDYVDPRSGAGRYQRIVAGAE